MHFRQILHHDLGCASYLLADGGEAAVIDPKWEVDEYLAVAGQAAATIVHILETHDHADHVSGRVRLRSATGAQLHLPIDPGDPSSHGLKDGDVVRVGRLELLALATPGHRPEHLAYLVRDGSRSTEEPCLLLAGDSLLVGDVARPDLAVSADVGARELWATLRRVDALPDHVELWPAHVGGSLCGSGSLSPKTSSTIGYERRANRLFALASREGFIAEVTRLTSPPPPNVERVVALNRHGAPPPEAPPELDAAALSDALAGGACVLDARSPEAFDSGHLAGALNLPLESRGLGTRAGWAAGVTALLVVVAGTPAAAARATGALQAAGLWNIAGVATADPAGWAAHGLAIRTAEAFTPERLAPRLLAGEARLLDVRDRSEWDAGHVPGSLHLPLAAIGEGDGIEIPDGPPLATVCAAGGRAAVAASVLRRRGHPILGRVAGGVEDLAAHGVPFSNGANGAP